MHILRRVLLPILLAAAWIGVSEFVRNELLLSSFWTDHYEGLGLVFPSEPLNGAVWGLWSLLFAVAMYALSRRFTWFETGLLAWFAGFVLLWVAIANLSVLPWGLLPAAVPLSLLEAFGAAFLLDRTAGRPGREDGAGEA